MTKYQGQLVYPGMTATLDDHSIQPISYSRRNIDKSTSMRMNWTQAASYKRQVSIGTKEDSGINEQFLMCFVMNVIFIFSQRINIFRPMKNPRVAVAVLVWAEFGL